MKYSKIGLILLAGMCFMSGCSNKSNMESTAEETESLSTDAVDNFVFNRDTSKVVLIKNGEDQTDITENTVNVSGGILYLTSEGIAEAFDLKHKEITEDEKESFLATLNAENMADTGGDLLCLVNDEHTLIFQDGNRMFTVDKVPAMLDSACLKLDTEEFSIPMTSLAFIFGYGSIGTSIQGDSIIYSLSQ